MKSLACGFAGIGGQGLEMIENNKKIKFKFLKWEMLDGDTGKCGANHPTSFRTSAGKTKAIDGFPSSRISLRLLARVEVLPDVDEGARVDDLGILPTAGKVVGVAGDYVVGFGRLGAFQENVVVRITGFRYAGGDYRAGCANLMQQEGGAPPAQWKTPAMKKPAFTNV